MPEMHLKQPDFTYRACGPFRKNKERTEKFMRTGNTDFIYKNELDEACFQHDMAYGKTKDSEKEHNRFLIKSPVEVISLMNQIINWQMNFINQLLENLKTKKFIHYLETIFGVLI